ncbi:hypothetical protein BCR32DRAFT_155238 [Anaeromyces robustus]|uniref:Uncharacterized protein n=1 Tax=Anaeromyces robustus TaxID=1754192 RepID=A0A1Y1UZK1_9FUNG|nr:hypothetical protein BCR32DRAFT_155238 [Anaeromyces robustus]|eukprot:ORX43351.1 hypothetical protein BCR32DRAFT_155238 [Anaeromyces robustus]
MGIQTLHNKYLVSEFEKAFSSQKDKLNSKLNNNNNNEQEKLKEKLSEQIKFFQKIADDDRKSIPSSPSLKTNRNILSNNVIIIGNQFLNNVYEGFNWNYDKYEVAWKNKNSSVASYYSRQHLPKNVKNYKPINRFPNSNIYFGKIKPKPFFIPKINVPKTEKEKRLFFRKSISYKYITFKSIDNLRCFSIPLKELCKISRPPSYKSFPSTQSNNNKSF